MISTGVTPFGDGEALRQLGDRIRQDRLRRNLTQEHIARQAGISLPTYRKVESGDGSVEMGIVARVLGVIGHVGKLGEIVPAPPPPLDVKAMQAPERLRARPKGKRKS